LYDVFHEALIPASSYEVPLLVSPARGVVSEVMGLVNDHEVVIAPVECFKIDVAGIPRVTAEVRMAENVISESVFTKGIQLVVQPVDGPVIAQLFRAKNQYALIAKLEKLDDPKGLVGFTKTDAVCQNAAVVGKNFVNDPLHAVFLEIEERPPNVAIEQRCPSEVFIGSAGITKELLKDLVESLVINELRRLVLIKLIQILKNLFFYILDKGGILP
jgi:hypothetical protein